MAQELESIDELAQYFRQIQDIARERPELNVDQVIPHLLAEVLRWKDPGMPVRVNTRGGVMKRVLWVRMRGRRWAFAYNHNAHCIELRGDSVRGEPEAIFGNPMSGENVRDIFTYCLFQESMAA